MAAILSMILADDFERLPIEIRLADAAQR